MREFAKLRKSKVDRAHRWCGAWKEDRTVDAVDGSKAREAEACELRENVGEWEWSESESEIQDGDRYGPALSRRGRPKVVQEGAQCCYWRAEHRAQSVSRDSIGILLGTLE